MVVKCLSQKLVHLKNFKTMLKFWWNYVNRANQWKREKEPRWSVILLSCRLLPAYLTKKPFTIFAEETVHVLLIKGTLMQIWKYCNTFFFIYKSTTQIAHYNIFHFLRYPLNIRSTLKHVKHPECLFTNIQKK